MIKCLLILFIWLSLTAVSQGGVFNKGVYSGEYTVIDCFKNNNYKGIWKADTIKANYIFKGTKIWRTINLENKENELIFNSTRKCTQIGLFEILKYGIFEKKLKAFSSDDFNNTKFTCLKEDQLLKLIMFKDSGTTLVFDSNGNQKQETTNVKRYMIGSDITSFLITENWVFNSYNGETQKIMIGIAPLILDNITQKIKPLFWIYFSEWKELLASFEAKNYYSNSIISFYDVFERKLFISKISKTSNVFDRSIKSIYHGNDNINESEIIKEKLMNQEEDLFEK